MSIDYIRRTYGVPAKRGGRVSYSIADGRCRFGTIASADRAYLRIRMDGDTMPQLYHPTWCLEYLPDERPSGGEGT